MAYAQVQTQVVRGTIKDEVTLKPIDGAVVIVNDTAISLSDERGAFYFKNIPIGYCTVIISMLGYERRVMTEVPLNPGRQVVLDISLNTTIKNISEVTVVEKRSKRDTFTATSGVSSISLDQIDHVAASYDDPARMLMSLAGVVSVSDLKNDIIVRGNSPSGVSYRLNGIEIPEPNHGAVVGAYAKVSIIKSELLSKFDFYKGAFPNQFNDLGSSVIDLSLRPGNTEKQEFSAKISMLGAEASAEGPFSKNSKASYVINYRYFTLLALNLAHIPIFPGQANSGAANVSNHDINLNINIPIRGGGKLSFFAISGYDIATNTNKSKAHTTDHFTTTSAGVNLSKYLFANTSINTTLGYTNALHSNLYTAITSSDSYVENLHSIRPAIQLNTRIKKKHQLKYGVEAAYHFFKLQDNYASPIFSALTAKALHNTFQAATYAQWSYRVNEKLLINAGLSLTAYRSLNTVSPEPRANIEYRVTPKQTFSVSAGMHSRMERLSYYLLDTISSSKSINNNGLGPTRFVALSAGYRHQISHSLFLIVDAYFQYLYDVPVYKATSGSWSAINNDYEYPKSALKNIGSGRNYGVELTLQKNFSKNYYFMASGSVYKSEQRLSQLSEWHPSRYDGGFIFNANGGKDFKVGKLKKNVLGLNARVIYAGGMRVSTPSRFYNGKRYINVFDENYSGQLKDYFRLDTKVSYQRNKKKWVWSLSLDIQNVTNQKNEQNQSLSSTAQIRSTSYDFGILPIVIFDAHF